MRWAIETSSPGSRPISVVTSACADLVEGRRARVQQALLPYVELVDEHELVPIFFTPRIVWVPFGRSEML